MAKLKLEVVSKNFATDEEAKLRTQWEKDLSSYKRPARLDPLALRKSGLLCSGLTDCSLGYILYVDNVRVATMDAAAGELLFDDPEPMRGAMLHMKTGVGFHVYYKDSAYWYGVPKHFDTLAQAIPYLQGGNRVLIEYRKTI